MKIDIQKKQIQVRVTELTSWLKCWRQGFLQIKYGSIEEPKGEALYIGEKVHKCIYELMINGATTFDMETSPILNTGCKFEDYIPRVTKELVSHDTIPGEYTTKEKSQISKNKFKGFRVESHENFSMVWHTNGVPSSDLTISDVMYPEMFNGVNLTLFETPLKYEYISMGWQITITGTADAMTADASTIVDWKTIATTPARPLSYRYLGYYVQQGLYRSLALKMLNKPLTEGNGILAFLVKTKTPKFVVSKFRLTIQNLLAIDSYVYTYLDGLIKFLNSDNLPYPSYGEHCDYCGCKIKCSYITDIIPEIVKE